MLDIELPDSRFPLFVFFYGMQSQYGHHKATQTFTHLECQNLDALTPAASGLELKIAFEPYVAPGRTLPSPISRSRVGSPTFLTEQELACKALEHGNFMCVSIKQLRYRDLSRSVVMTCGIQESSATELCRPHAPPAKADAKAKVRAPKTNLVGDLLKPSRQPAGRHRCRAPAETVLPGPNPEVAIGGIMDHLSDLGMGSMDVFGPTLPPEECLMMPVDAALLSAIVAEHDLEQPSGEEDNGEYGDDSHDGDDSEEEEGSSDVEHAHHDDADANEEDQAEPWPWDVISEEPRGTIRRKSDGYPMGRVHQMPHAAHLSWKATCKLPGHNCVCWVTARGAGDWSPAKLELDVKKWLVEGIGLGPLDHKQRCQELKREYGMRVKNVVG